MERPSSTIMPRNTPTPLRWESFYNHATAHEARVNARIITRVDARIKTRVNVWVWVRVRVRVSVRVGFRVWVWVRGVSLHLLCLTPVVSLWHHCPVVTSFDNLLW